MNDKVKEDILAVIQKVIEAFRAKKYFDLRDISNQTTHSASIYGDEDAIAVAVVVYTLFKIVSRDFYDQGLDDEIVSQFLRAQDCLNKGNQSGFRQIFQRLGGVLGQKDPKIKRYLKSIVYHAQTVKGSRLYEHGISLASAAETLGVSHWDLMSYVGKTGIPEAASDTNTGREEMKQRLKFARSLFGA
ncbi:MAG: hypothetical protein Q7R76_05875 [Candidatus Woesearchaeota archaeon]|nr:hypothetical protein [Candidatus Woesearchaeota archaeon]